MSLLDIEKQVLELPEEERRQFASWFIQNQHRIVPPPLDEDELKEVELSEAAKAELLLRKQEYFDHPERFRSVKNRQELRQYLAEIHDKVRARISSSH